MRIRVAAPRPNRNQNIARNPRYCEMIPPNTGPIDCPIIRTVELAELYIDREQTNCHQIFLSVRPSL